MRNLNQHTERVIKHERTKLPKRTTSEEKTPVNLIQEKKELEVL